MGGPRSGARPGCGTAGRAGCRRACGHIPAFLPRCGAALRAGLGAGLRGSSGLRAGSRRFSGSHWLSRGQGRSSAARKKCPASKSRGGVTDAQKVQQWCPARLPRAARARGRERPEKKGDAGPGTAAGAAPPNPARSPGGFFWGQTPDREREPVAKAGARA